MTGESHDSGKPPANADKVNTGVAFSFTAFGYRIIGYKLIKFSKEELDEGRRQLAEIRTSFSKNTEINDVRDGIPTR